ncbi:MAG: SRPBCC family protein [Caldilineaceae bacterium]
MAFVVDHFIFRAPAARVWQTVSDFGNVDIWFPNVVDCKVKGSGVGAERTVTFADGFQSREQLLSLDVQGCSLSYLLLTDTALQKCLYTMSVRDIGEGYCELVWTCGFVAAGIPTIEAKGIVAGALAIGGAALQQLYERQLNEALY